MNFFSRPVISSVRVSSMQTMTTYSWYKCHVSNIQHLIMASCKNSSAQPVGFAHFVKMQLTNLSWCSEVLQLRNHQHHYSDFKRTGIPTSHLFTALLHIQGCIEEAAWQVVYFTCTFIQQPFSSTPWEIPRTSQAGWDIKKFLQQVDPEVSSQLDVPRTPPQGAPKRNPNIML